MLLAIDVTSFAIGVGTGLFFYLVVAVIAAFFMAKRMGQIDINNDEMLEKKLREAGYYDDIWE